MDTLRLENLTKRYGPLVAVDHLQLAIPPGVVFGLLGPNGAGKTTTLEMIEGLRRPDEGRVLYGDVDLLRRPQVARLRFGIQLQSSAFLDLLTVEETLRLFAALYPRAAAVEPLIDRFDLAEKRRTQVKDLSGGQRQRLAVATALVHDPEVVFLDEPTAGLDPQARRHLWDQVRRLRADGRTVVLTTHYMDEAAYLCDQLAIIDHGRVLDQGSPQELVARHLPGAVIELAPEVPVPDDARLPGLVRVERTGGGTALETANLAETLAGLVAWARARRRPHRPEHAQRHPRGRLPQAHGKEPARWKGIAVLARALFHSNVRNRQGLFWSLFFPVVLMLVFGLLDNGGGFRVNLAVAGPPGPVHDQVVAAFSRIPIFKVADQDPATALAAVRKGSEDAVLVVPAQAEPGQPLPLTLYYNDANYVTAEQTVAAVQAAVSSLDVAISGRPPALTLDAKPVANSLRTTLLDFLLPGLVSLMVMQNALFGVGSGLTRWKEKGILRRFLATPLRPVQFLAAVVLTNLLFGLVTIAIIIAIGVGVLHAHVTLPLLPLLVVVVLGMAVFLSIAFIVAGVARTQEATIPIINLVTFPMMFLSGVFFPVSTLPAFLQRLVGLLPLTYLTDATRALMSGSLAVPRAVDVLGLTAWLVVCAAVSVRTWRWE
jgi:ABC-2 type transport system ATP-binding protein